MLKQLSQKPDNSDSSVINSPLNSPNSNSSNNFSSNPNSYNNLHQLNASPAQPAQNAANFSNINSSPSIKRNSSVNQSELGTTSRALSRSNSVNSLNTLNEAGLTTAEQKRRCKIQHGFDRLQTLVPSLRDVKNSKASKAAMLQKTSEYIKELQRAKEKRMADLDVYNREIEELSDKISEYQNQLPANGVSVLGNLNKTEQFEQKFNAYVKEKTVENWKFYLFSLILKPLFDNFVTTINTASKEDMERTFYDWQQKYCNLTQLRPSMFLFFEFVKDFFVYFYSSRKEFSRKKKSLKIFLVS